MTNKKNNNLSSLVYSTDKPYFDAMNQETQSAAITLEPEKQKLNVVLDTKQRAGKIATLIKGFCGSNDDLDTLGKKIKTKCGVGGSIKDGIILIQGDFKIKIIHWLIEWGYKNTKG